MKNMINKYLSTFSILLGLFFLFSVLSKVVTISDWMEFNYMLVENNIGYFNAALILLIEGVFATQFLRRKISFELLGSSFLFVLLLTLFVFLNQELFASCMCFGTVIDVKPDWTFAVKNILVLLVIAVTAYLFFKTQNQHINS